MECSLRHSDIFDGDFLENPENIEGWRALYEEIYSRATAAEQKLLEGFVRNAQNDHLKGALIVLFYRYRPRKAARLAWTGGPIEDFCPYCGVDMDK